LIRRAKQAQDGIVGRVASEPLRDSSTPHLPAKFNWQIRDEPHLAPQHLRDLRHGGD
jgi:hypothetical protein